MEQQNELGQDSGNIPGQAQWTLEQTRKLIQASEGLRIVGESAPLFAALAAAQAAFQPITKNRTVKVHPKKRDDGYQPPPYTFDYATLDEVQAKTLPALNANGLSILQPFFDTKGGRVLRTILAHSSGARLEADVSLPQTRDIQDAGKAITYLKRYQWGAMIGVNPEEDDDGNAADGNQAETAPRDRQKPPIPPTKAAPKAPPPPKEAPAVEQKPAQEVPSATAKPSEPPPAKAAPEVTQSAPLSDATGKRLGLGFRRLEYVGAAAREFLSEQLGRTINQGDKITEDEGLKAIAALNAEGKAMKEGWEDV